MDEKLLLILIFSAILLLLLIGMIVFLRSSERRNRELSERMMKQIGDVQQRNTDMVMSLNNSINDNINEVKLSLNREFLDFSSRMNQDFANLHEKTTSRILMMEERVNKNLSDSGERSDRIYAEIRDRMTRIDEAQREFGEISREIVSLQNILRDKKSRGVFGEVELYNLLESVLGSEGTLFKRQVTLSNGSIADAVILAGEQIGMICVDSKFPLENYRKMVDLEAPKGERDNARKAFVNDVRKHIKDIHDKYLIEGETADSAYLFLPAEAVYSEIYAHFEDLVDYSYRQHVYLVSPTTLVAYLTAVKNSYLGVKKDEKAREIRELLQALSRDFENYRERTNNLARHFSDLENDFRDIDNTSKKILKKFDRIKDGDIYEETTAD